MPLHIETERLIICDLLPEMAKTLSENSLDEANRRFVPDEVFETEEDALETIRFLMGQYDTADGPQVHPVLTRAGENIGYVQLCPVEEGWEIGYHIAEKYRCRGYAAEAVKAFLPVMAEKYNADTVWGICLEENIPSVHVLEKCGFRLFFHGVGDYQGEMRSLYKFRWQRNG